MNNSPIRTLYLNCQRLGLYRLKIVLDFYLKTYQLIFLSKTWFIDHDQICQHPNFVTHTPLTSFHANRHQTDGMTLFCSNSARAQLSSIRCTKQYYLGMLCFTVLPWLSTLNPLSQRRETTPALLIHQG
ncbi:hypothetical protein DSO57_1032372 [Entomophthora muscae]|uniref:Uncharacterized protein n=1 Tax=Entomophthora muscae TaxID=34485 RepID=A0ACC2RF49_9FUNG|nr:hypothetical protein DSO57_1032372 [Entomophthora muscae]